MALAVIVLLQLLLNAGKILLLPLLPQTGFAQKMLTMCLMLVLSAGLAAWIRIKKYRLPVFPERFSGPYIICNMCRCRAVYSSTGKLC